MKRLLYCLGHASGAPGTDRPAFAIRSKHLDAHLIFGRKILSPLTRATPNDCSREEHKLARMCGQREKFLSSGSDWPHAENDQTALTRVRRVQISEWSSYVSTPRFNTNCSLTAVANQQHLAQQHPPAHRSLSLYYSDCAKAEGAISPTPTERPRQHLSAASRCTSCNEGIALAML
jgi:hypothetical protein